MSSPKKAGGKAGRRTRITVVLPATKAPRNPVVRALLQQAVTQSAGRHQRSGKAQRRADKISLRKVV